MPTIATRHADAAIVSDARDVDHAEIAPGHAERGEAVRVGRLAPELAHRGQSDEHDARHDCDEREHEQRAPFEIDDPAHGRQIDFARRTRLVEPPLRRRLVQRRVERRPGGGSAAETHEHARAVAGEASAVRGHERRAGEDVLVAGNRRVRQAPQVVGLHVVEGTDDTDDLRRERRRLRRDRAVDRRVQIGLGPTRHAHRVAGVKAGGAGGGFAQHDLVRGVVAVRAPVQDDRSSREAPRTRRDAREQRQPAPVVRHLRVEQRNHCRRRDRRALHARHPVEYLTEPLGHHRIRALRDEIGFTFDGVRIDAGRAAEHDLVVDAAAARRSARATCRPARGRLERRADHARGQPRDHGEEERRAPVPAPRGPQQHSDGADPRHSARVCTNPVRSGSLPAGGAGGG